MTVKRDAKVYSMKFKGGEKASELKVTGKVGMRNTGTTVTFLPDEKYFDSVKISIPRLKHVLRQSGSVFRPAGDVVDNTVSTAKAQSEEWYFEDGLTDYLLQATADYECIPQEPFVGSIKGNDEAVDWALHWLPDGGEVIGKLCQPDTDRARRHPRQRLAYRIVRSTAGILQIPKSAAPRHQAHGRRCLGKVQLCTVFQTG